MRKGFLSVVFASIVASGFCYRAASRESESQNVVVETIHRFAPNLSISLENLAVRQTGEIIVTFDNHPTIYQIEPEVNGTATYIHTFEGYIGLHGIVEVQPDQFYITAGNLSLVTHIDVPGSSSVFHVNMTRFPEHIEVHKVADFPDSRILNGMTLLSKEEGLVYVADSRVGVVNILNVNTGKHFVAINDTLTNQPPGASEISNCVHGVHVIQATPYSQKYLYFSNYAQGIIGRVPIHDDGLASGLAEVVVGNLTTPEDFILDKEGNIFLALFEANEFIRIDAETQRITVLAGNPDSPEYKWAAAVEFGRKESDKNSLYATINGGYLQPDNVGGALFRIGPLAVV
ncbi:hypothetical protein DFJ43DRAFT_1039911 [Lentinula guzmanii]|uniref:Uncharacterized protein n=1 Tax=Lentinula guzmanii TaxID=2804957 RepID=A0AA38MTF0_9AGAR|nr:hypothetical protein DFJ43DRAFT_1039911 [Lentinula guzmanii]